MIAASYLFAASEPTYQDLRTEGLRHTQQYRSTTETALRTYMEEYVRLEVRKAENPQTVGAIEAQQRVILSRMRVEAAKIHVPDDVQVFLEDHKR